jgi:hypothetical protein
MQCADTLRAEALRADAARFAIRDVGLVAVAIPAPAAPASFSIQHVSYDDLGEVHDQLAQLLVLLNDRVEVRTARVGSTWRRDALPLAMEIRHIRASHG